MTQSRQRNSHARSKRKRKMLRIKNRLEGVIAKRVIRRRKANADAGNTFRATGTLRAVNVAQYSEVRALYDHGHRRRLNQRQLRKRLRQSAWFKRVA